MPLLDVRHLKKSFRTHDAFGSRRGELVAVDDISFQLNQGETLGLVGESGCGKSTTGKLIMQLLKADAGQVLFDGTELTHLTPRRLRPLRRQLQMIFQDPFSSLNPRMTVGEILSEPFCIHNLSRKGEQQEQLIQLLERVGLNADHARRYPHEFSGGQRQRVGIARALAVQPKLIIADEPVSALDLSVQAQILNLLQDIQREHQLSYLFIAHDLAVIEHVSDRIAVMYLGKIVEFTTAEKLYRTPRHPYTEALLNAVPTPDPGQARPLPLSGEIPSPVNPPCGCSFHPRCPYADQHCRSVAPELTICGQDHLVACHYQDQVGRFLRNRHS